MRSANLALLMLLVSGAVADRETILFDFGWRFYRGTPGAACAASAFPQNLSGIECAGKKMQRGIGRHGRTKDRGNKFRDLGKSSRHLGDRETIRHPSPTVNGIGGTTGAAVGHCQSQDTGALSRQQQRQQTAGSGSEQGTLLFCICDRGATAA